MKNRSMFCVLFGDFVSEKLHPTQRKWTISEKRIPAIRSRVFPEYVCIEDVDKIISIVHDSRGSACLRLAGKHLTASETRFTPIESSRFPVWTERVRLAEQRQLTPGRHFTAEITSDLGAFLVTTLQMLGTMGLLKSRPFKSYKTRLGVIV